MTNIRYEKTPNQDRVFDTPTFTVTGKVIVEETLTGSYVQSTSGSFDRVNTGRWVAVGGKTLVAHGADTASGSYFAYGVTFPATPRVLVTLTGSLGVLAAVTVALTGSVYVSGSSTTGSYLVYSGVPSAELGVNWIALNTGV